jgi:hypothetical protein
MEPLDYFERESGRTFASLTATYAASNEHIHRAVTLLTGGGGAASAYVLSKLGVTEALAIWQWLPIAALAAWWFVLAALLMIFGIGSTELSSGPMPRDLGKLYLVKGGTEDASQKDVNAAALHALRWAELRGLEEAMSAYHSAISRRSRWLDGVYRATALSAVPAAVAYWLAR